MNSIHYILTCNTIDKHPGPRLVSVVRSIQTEADHPLLQRLQELRGGSEQPARRPPAHVPDRKIMAVEPVGNRHAHDRVIGGCCVTYSVDGGPDQNALLVHRARSGLGSGVIPVSSSLGATLLSMRIGQSAPYPCKGGAIMSVSVLGVAPPN